MASSSIHISLPAPLKAYVDAQVDSGGYGTPDDFFRDLLEDDRERRMVLLEEHLLENMKSTPIPISDEELDKGKFIDLSRRKLQAL